MQDLDQKKIAARFLRRLPDYLTLVLIVVCGSLLARLTWLVFPADPALLSQNRISQYSVGSTDNVQLVKAKAPRVNIGEDIARYHMFGQVQLAALKPTTQTATPPPVMKKPRVPIEVAGIYALPGKRALAILKIRDVQEVFSVGEALKLFPNTEKEQAIGAVLKSVTENKVVVQWDDGSLQEWDLKQAEEQQEAQERKQNSQANQAVASVSPPMTESPTMLLKQGDSGEVDLAQFRNSVMEDNTRFMEMVRPSPVLENGQLKGFRVNPGSNVQLFQSSGLFSGDIVTEVNGVPLNNLASGLQVMQGLSSASGITLKVIRSGQEITIQRSF